MSENLHLNELKLKSSSSFALTIIGGSEGGLLWTELSIITEASAGQHCFSSYSPIAGLGSLISQQVPTCLAL